MAGTVRRRRPAAGLVAALVASSIGVFAPVSPALTVFTVTSAGDGGDADTTDGICDDGVWAMSPDNTIGGTTPAARNLIAGSSGYSSRAAGPRATWSRGTSSGPTSPAP